MKHVYPLQDGGLDPLAPTIFHEAWWLDIATGGRYEMAEVRSGGKRLGWLPYFLQRQFGLKFSIPPRMTHFLGPAVDAGGGGMEAEAHQRACVTRELLAKLPPATLYHYKCGRNIGDAVAFQLENFATSVQFTQELMPLPADMLWRNMRKKKRSQIRRAQEVLAVSGLDDLELFWRFYVENLERRGLRNYYVRNDILRGLEQSLSRQRGQIYAARDRAGALAAAIWCIWDSACAYYFMSSRTARAHDGAVSLLLWEAIKDAAQRGLIFDFDGFSNHESVAFFGGFGGSFQPRYRATRTSTFGRLIWEVKELRRANRFFC